LKTASCFKYFEKTGNQLFENVRFHLFQKSQDFPGDASLYPLPPRFMVDMTGAAAIVVGILAKADISRQVLLRIAVWQNG
jgi:hypothetical protein